MKNERILIGAAREHLRQGRLAQAQALAGAWQQRVPGAAAPQALQVLLELAAGRLETGRAQALQAVARDAHCALAYFALAHVHLADERADDALTCAQRAQSLAPDDVEVLRLLARLRLQADEPRLAETLLRSALALDANDEQTTLMLSELLLNQPDGDVAEAERLARKVCAAAPHLGAAWALHGMALLRFDQAQEGRAKLELALELEPDQSAYLLPLAQVLLNEATPLALEQAASHARRVTALTPHDWRGAGLLSQILRRQREPAAALQVLVGASKMLPQEVELLFEIAQACEEMGQIVAGLEVLQRAQLLAPPGHRLHRLRAALHWRHGDLDAAGAAFDALDRLEHADARRLNLPLQVAQIRQCVVCLFAQSAAQCLLLVRYAAPLAAAGARVTLLAPVSLAPLLARVQGVERISSENELDAQWMEPMLRLPLLLEQSKPAFEAAYLCADATAVAHARAVRVAHAGPCVLLDLGGQVDTALLDKLGCWLLERQALALMMSPLPAWHAMGLACRHIDAQDIEALAAWVTVADVVLSGDVPLAHLAGGMGMAAQVLLPLEHDALWGMRADSTLWYPSLRLHHEPLSGNWIDGWDRLEAALTAQLEEPRPKAAA